MPISGLIQLDESLGTKGMLTEVAWRSVEFGLGYGLLVQGKVSLDTTEPGWKEQQYKKVVFAVALSRL